MITISLSSDGERIVGGLDPIQQYFLDTRIDAGALNLCAAANLIPCTFTALAATRRPRRSIW